MLYVLEKQNENKTTRNHPQACIASLMPQSTGTWTTEQTLLCDRGSLLRNKKVPPPKSSSRKPAKPHTAYFCSHVLPDRAPVLYCSLGTLPHALQLYHTDILSNCPHTSALMLGLAKWVRNQQHQQLVSLPLVLGSPSVVI